VLTKLQVVFSVLIGLALVVFAAAILTNVNVPKVPNWVPIVVWSTFGVMVACCIGVVITLMLEYREKKEPDEEEVEEVPIEEAGELAAVGAMSEMDAGEGLADAGVEPGELHDGSSLEVEHGEPMMHDEAEHFSHEPAAEHEAAPHVDELPDLDVDFSEE
jgi:hypothetical protein